MDNESPQYKLKKSKKYFVELMIIQTKKNILGAIWVYQFRVIISQITDKYALKKFNGPA